MADTEGAAPLPPLPPPIDGVEQRLDLLLAELRAIRARLAPPPPPTDGTVELREPAKRRGQRGG